MEDKDDCGKNNSHYQTPRISLLKNQVTVILTMGTSQMKGRGDTHCTIYLRYNHLEVK
jgi:hypothetical protein